MLRPDKMVSETPSFPDRPLKNLQRLLIERDLVTRFRTEDVPPRMTKVI